MRTLNPARLASGSRMPGGFPRPLSVLPVVLGLALFVVAAFSCSADTITTYAGNGTADYTGDGGPATNALIGPPASPWTRRGISTSPASTCLSCAA